jgi:hypothetical protein
MTVDPQRRYAGKPLVRFLDAYVLWTIGALPQEQNSQLQQMTPKLRETWKCSGEHWHEALASAMQFPATLPDAIREMWTKNKALDSANRSKLSPLDFAYLFVDQNFNQ